MPDPPWSVGVATTPSILKLRIFRTLSFLWRHLSALDPVNDIRPPQNLGMLVHVGRDGEQVQAPFLRFVIVTVMAMLLENDSTFSTYRAADSFCETFSMIESLVGAAFCGLVRMHASRSGKRGREGSLRLFILIAAHGYPVTCQNNRQSTPKDPSNEVQRTCRSSVLRSAGKIRILTFGPRQSLRGKPCRRLRVLRWRRKANIPTSKFGC